MARIRTIKPDFFLDSKLAKKSALCRLFFIGLWNQADKNGVLEEDKDRLKVQILPYNKANIEALLTELEPDFILRYETDGKQYIWIKNFKKHQRPHPKEAETGYPMPTKEQQSREIKLQAVKFSNASRVVAGGKGREGVSFPLDTGITTLSPAGDAPANDLSKPERKESQNPIHRLVRAWKRMLEVPEEEWETWDKANFARSCRSAKLLLEICKGDLEQAADCAGDIYQDLKAKGLSCTLETVVKKAHEWRQVNGKIASPA